MNDIHVPKHICRLGTEATRLREIIEAALLDDGATDEPVEVPIVEAARVIMQLTASHMQALVRLFNSPVAKRAGSNHGETKHTYRLAGRLEEAIDRLLDTWRDVLEQLAISAVTWMELVYGAEHSAQPQENLAVAEGLAARLAVLDYDAAAATHTGQIRAEPAQRGTPTGPYDQMIAGHARSRGLIVVTNNTREFARVAGLRCEDWTRT